MTEIWLRANTRALWFTIVVPAAVCVLGLVLASGLVETAPRTWVRMLGGVLSAAGGMAVAGFVFQLRRPRLAYRDGTLLVYLRHGGPIRLPIRVVEGFLLGQGPSMLPGKKHRLTETANVVLRLADLATEWSHMDVQPALGKWCDGYITIRGTWCEPLNLDVIHQLNRRLAEVTRELQLPRLMK